MQPITLQQAGTPASKAEQAIAALFALIERGYSLCMTASGKDSTVATILTLEAIRRANVAQVDQAPHFVTSADTLIDNPPLSMHIRGFLDEVADYSDKNKLNVTTHIAKPALASQFVVSTIGRGTLPRTVHNSVKEGKGVRPCSDDWKVRPQKKLKAKLCDDAIQQGYLPPITILGTRHSESSTRDANMRRRGESAHSVLVGPDGDLTFSPIAEWDTDDVWSFLSQFGNETLAPFPAPVSSDCINRLHALYRDANDGICGVILGESGTRKPCQSRFGCAFCLVSGPKDTSMESMIAEPGHAHLKGLNSFRNYLMATQWDLSLREIIGRTISPAGYVRIQPDVYSFEHRMTLLQMLLTLDVREAERAEKLTDDIDAGLVDDTHANRALCEPQFEFITPQQLVAIDFQLGLHHSCPHAFPAIAAWFEIRKFGRRYDIPTIEHPAQQKPIPLHGWFHVGGNFDANVPTDGLRSYQDELWNKYRHPDRISTYAQTPTGERVCYFEEKDSFSVDALDASLFVTCAFNTKMLVEARYSSGLESSRLYLNEGLIKLPKGKTDKYNHMARRAQYFSHLCTKLNLSEKEMNQFVISRSISNPDHTKLLDKKNSTHSPQPDLFSEIF